MSGASTASLFGSYPWKKRSFPPVHVQCPQIHIHTALCDDDDDCAGCRSNRQQESPALLVRRVAAPRLPRWASAHDRRAQLWAMGAIAVTRRRHSAPRQHRARSLATGGVGRRCLSDASSQQRKGRPLPLPLQLQLQQRVLTAGSIAIASPRILARLMMIKCGTVCKA